MTTTPTDADGEFLSLRTDDAADADRLVLRQWNNTSQIGVGTTFLGYVTRVAAHETHVALPLGLQGVIPSPSGSDTAADHIRLQPGSAVRVVVTAVRTERYGDAPARANTTTTTRRASQSTLVLSAAPALVNRGATLSTTLTSYGLLQVRIRQPEGEHGGRYSVEVFGDTAANDSRVLLQDAPPDLPPGTVLWAVPLCFDERRRTARLTAERDAVLDAVTHLDGPLSSLSAGMRVEAQVARLTTAGAELQFLNVFSGHAPWYHLPEGKRRNVLAVGRRLAARLLAVDPVRRRLVLTLRPELVARLEVPLSLSDMERVPRGQFLHDTKVIRAERRVGVYFQATTFRQLLLFAPPSRLRDGTVKRVDRAFPVGTRAPPARVLRHRPIDGVVVVSLQPSVLERKYLDYRELQPGQRVTCTLLSLSTLAAAADASTPIRGAVVRIEDSLRGFVPTAHLSEVPLSARRLRAKLPTGTALRCRVLTVDVHRRRAVLTARRALVDTALPPLHDRSAVRPGDRTVGWVSGRVQATGDWLVSFCNGIRGRLPASAPTETAGVDIGRSVRVTVTAVDAAGQRLQLRLRTDGDAAPIAACPFARGERLCVQRAERDASRRLRVWVRRLEDATDEALAVEAEALLPPEHLTDFAMLQPAWEDGEGLRALVGEEVVLLVDGRDGQEPMVSHRRGLRMAAQRGLWSADIPKETVEPGIRISPNSLAIGYVESFAANAAGVQVQLMASGERVFCPRALVADRFVHDPAHWLQLGQAVWCVRNGSADTDRISLRWSEVAAAMAAAGQPWTALYRDMRSLAGFFREQQRLCSRRGREWPHPPPGTVVQGTVMEAGAPSSEPSVVWLQVEHDGRSLRACLMSAHDEHDRLGRWEAGAVVNAVVLAVDPLADRLYVSDRAKLVQLAPWYWWGEPAAPNCTVAEGALTGTVELVLPDYAVVRIDRCLALLSRQEVNAGDAERPLTIGQTVSVLPDDRRRPTEAATVTEAWWTRAWTVRAPAAATTDGRLRTCLSFRVGDRVRDALVTAIHPFQVNVRVQASGVHVGRIHITHVDASEQWEQLSVGQVVPWARVVDVRERHRLELSLRAADLETPGSSRDHPGETAGRDTPTVGAQYARGVVKSVEWDGDDRARATAAWVMLTPKVTARITAFDAQPQRLEQWAPGTEVHEVLVYRVDATTRHYDAALGASLRPGQRIDHATVVTVRARDGEAWVQLPGDRLGTLPFACVTATDAATEAYPLRCLHPGQPLSVFVIDGTDPTHPERPLLSLDPQRVPPAVEQLRAGEAVDALVRHVDAHGAFFHIAPGVIGRCLLRDLSSGFVRDPSTAFPVGMRVRATVLSVDAAARRVQLTLRDAAPARTAAYLTAALPVGTVTSGTVSGVAEYGVFVELPGLNMRVCGLCHRSELRDALPPPSAADIAEAYRVGQRVRVRVLAVNAKGQVALSLKASQVQNEEAEMADVESEPESTGAESEDEALTIAPPHKPHLRWSGTELADGIPSSSSDSPSTADMAACERGDRRPASAHAAFPRPSFALTETEFREQQLVTALEQPQTPEDFERALLGRPNDASLWVSYMAMRAAAGEVNKALALAERALETVHFREDAQRLRLWLAYLNLARHATPGMHPLDNELFRRAVQNCDGQTLHLRYARALEAAGDGRAAEQVYLQACRRYGKHSERVWIECGAFYMLRQGHAGGARRLLERALLSLPRGPLHLHCILKFATFEFKSPAGDVERGRTILENLVASFPARLDLWNVYLDMELARMQRQPSEPQLATVRRLFQRCTALRNLSLKKAKHFFKRFLQAEQTYGDAASVERVKQAARDYIESAAEGGPP